MIGWFAPLLAALLLAAGGTTPPSPTDGARATTSRVVLAEIDLKPVVAERTLILQDARGPIWQFRS